MLDRFIYENHLGMRFDGLENGVFLNHSNLRDYLWEYDTLNNRISRFYLPISDRLIPVTIACKTAEEAMAAKNRLLDLADSDIQAKLPGKLWVGEYYTQGYIRSSIKSEYLITKNSCKIELCLTSDDPAWYREQTYVFNNNTSVTIGASGASDFPYDFPYDYAVSLQGKNIVCDSVWDSMFRLRIYGPVENPTVFVGGHAYTINGVIGWGNTLLIDSMNKTITLTTETGGKINWFDKRGRDSYIFKPIPVGQNAVSWSGRFRFDLTVIEKRSEPKWT